MSQKSSRSPTLNKPFSWFKKTKTLNNILFSMKLQNPQFKSNNLDQPNINKTQNLDDPNQLNDEILIKILSRVPEAHKNPNYLVSKQWLNLQGRLVRSVRVLDWDFLVSGRLFSRFPNLVHVDLIHGCFNFDSPPKICILLNLDFGSFHVDLDYLNDGLCVLSSEEVDLGLKVLANGYPNLRKLAVVNASEIGLLSIGEECLILQELELHLCNDRVLCGIAVFRNLQILKLVGSVDGVYDGLVSDVGLTILAQGCKRLVKLELRGCGGSYDGIKAIGQCCQMLEELSFSDHRIEDGWLSALSYCDNLKTLRFVSCKSIDRSPAIDRDMGVCPALERLHMEKCQLRQKRSVRALFLLCRSARELVFNNCWGLTDDIFGTGKICRRVNSLSLEGCSRLTVEGLASAIFYWNDLESLSVTSCSNIKDSEVTPELATLFSALKKFTWKADTRSLLSASLVGTGMGKRGKIFGKK
ncbi:F-box protein At5g51370-like [Apium graveolens]|uniref:F-box protein At5g51370-like n=1 Tax=Apium graveolens TaxID=4045 RepID=UPI003D7AEF2E